MYFIHKMIPAMLYMYVRMYVCMYVRTYVYIDCDSFQFVICIILKAHIISVFISLINIRCH